MSKVVGEKKIYDTPDSAVRKVWAEVLPPKYYDNTELRLNVKLGENKQDYALKAKFACRSTARRSAEDAVFYRRRSRY